MYDAHVGRRPKEPYIYGLSHSKCTSDSRETSRTPLDLRHTSYLTFYFWDDPTGMQLILKTPTSEDWICEIWQKKIQVSLMVFWKDHWSWISIKSHTKNMAAQQLSFKENCLVLGTTIPMVTTEGRTYGDAHDFGGQTHIKVLKFTRL